MMEALQSDVFNTILFPDVNTCLCALGNSTPLLNSPSIHSIAKLI